MISRRLCFITLCLFIFSSQLTLAGDETDTSTTVDIGSGPAVDAKDDTSTTNNPGSMDFQNSIKKPPAWMQGKPAKKETSLLTEVLPITGDLYDTQILTVSQMTNSAIAEQTRKDLELARGCKVRNPTSTSAQAIKLSDTSNQVNGFLNCSFGATDNDYSDCSCQRYTQCAQYVFSLPTMTRGADDYSGFSSPKDKALFKIEEKIADRFIEFKLKGNLKDIEFYKTLRKYAETRSKRIDIPPISECEEKTKSDSATCDSKSLDRKFVSMQSNCNSNSGFTCLGNQVLDNILNNTQSSSRYGNTDQFLADQASAKVDKMSEDDLEATSLREVQKVFFNFQFKENAQIEKAIKSKLDELSKANKIDLGLDIVRKSKNDIHELVAKLKSEVANHKTSDLVTAGRVQNSNDIYFDIEDFKNSKVKAVFSAGNCKIIPTIKSICEMANEIKNHNKTSIDKFYDETIADIYKNDINADKDLLDEIKKFGIKIDSTQLMTIQKSVRCQNFKFDYDSSGATEYCGFDPKPSSSSTGDIVFGTSNVNSTTGVATVNTPGKSDDFSSPEVSKTMDSASLKTAAEAATPANPTAKADEVTPAAPSPAPQSASNTNVPPAVDTTSTQPIAKPIDTDSTPFSSSALEAKVTELTSKLSENEKAIARLQNPSDTQSASIRPDDRDKQIDDYKKQNAELTVALEQAKAKAAASVDNGIQALGGTSRPTQVSSGSLFSSTDPSREVSSSYINEPKSGPAAPINPNAPIPSASAPFAGEGSTSTVVTGVKSGSSSPSSQATTAAALKAGGITLTQLDGLTSEQANATIESKIAAGQDVFVADKDGNILVVVKDDSGKVVYDELGKPKFVVDQKATEIAKSKKLKGRQIASVASEDRAISSPADAQKAQEAALKRAEYERLKAITRQAMSNQ